MLKNFIIFVVLSYLLLNACESPTSINAARKIGEIDDPNFKIDAYKYNTSEVNLGYLERDFVTSFQIVVYNQLNIPFRIEKLLFTKNDNFTILNESSLPIDLAAKGNKNDRVTLTVITRFQDNPFYFGSFNDTMYINSVDNPALPISFIIPQILVKDLDYGKVKVGNRVTKAFEIINQGDIKVNLREWELISNNDYYTIESESTIKRVLNSKEKTTVYLKLQPKSTGNLNASIKFSAFPLLEQSKLTSYIRAVGID